MTALEVAQDILQDVLNGKGGNTTKQMILLASVVIHLNKMMPDDETVQGVINTPGDFTRVEN